MRNILLLILPLLMTSSLLSAQEQHTDLPGTHTSVGIIIYSNDTETVWNALRFANYARSEGDTVSVFLLGKGVELDQMVTTNNDIHEQYIAFMEQGGTILGCGTCLASRKILQPTVCKYSSMGDLYKLARQSKMLLTF